MRNYKRVSRLFVFSVILSAIAVLGVLFFCLNVLFDVSLFRFAVFEPRRGDFYFAVLMCCLFGINDLFDVNLFVLFRQPRCGDFYFALPNAHQFIVDIRYDRCLLPGRCFSRYRIERSRHGYGCL